MAKRRQLVLMPVAEGTSLGSLRAFKERLAPFNTAPDGSPTGQMGTHRLHGPGMVIDVPTQDEITQAMVTVVEEDIAWPVLTRICKNLKWKMIDLETGRSFG